MNALAIESDFLFSLVGSTLFWLTLAGISMRALRIDFKTLEAHLNSFYLKADGLSFPLAKTSTFFADRAFGAIYGKGLLRRFLVTLLVCIVGCAFIFSTFLADWHQKRPQVDAVIRKAIADVDPEYFDLVKSEDGRERLAVAHAQSGNQGGVWFVHNDERSRALRSAHDRFWPRYRAYISGHHLTRYDAIDRYFGKAYSNPFWRGRGRQWVQLFFGILLTIGGSAVVDFLAVGATLLFYEKLKERRTRSLVYLFAILVCVVLSEVSSSVIV